MTLSCVACGDEQTRAGYVAVGPSTPAAQVLDLTGRRPVDHRGHYVVCELCFDRAVRKIEQRGRGTTYRGP